MITVSDIVDALGGTSKVARLFGVTAPAISNWRAANRFPPRTHFKLYRLCLERGVDLPMSMLTGDGPEQAA